MTRPSRGAGRRNPLGRSPGWLLLVLVVAGVLNYWQGPASESASAPAFPTAAGAVHPIQDAWQRQISDLQSEGEGRVIKVLRDDLEGSRHQRFVLELEWGQTLLVAHNIDLAPRIEGLKVGDQVAFFGEYEWNPKGGVMHWTHHDPRSRHPHGWLRHQGRLYQ